MKKDKTPKIDYDSPDYCEGTRTYFGPIRDARGRLARWQGGSYFSSSERFSMYDFNPRWASIEWQIQVVELNNGKWLSQHLSVYARQFDSRDQALRFAAARILRQARAFFRHPRDRVRPRLCEAEYRAVIAWVHQVLDRPAPNPYVAPKALLVPVVAPRPTPPMTLLDLMEAS